MNCANRPALPSFAAVAGLLGLGTLALTLSLTGATAGHALAFGGGFGGALLAGLAVPRVRRRLLEPFGRAGSGRGSRPHAPAGVEGLATVRPEGTRSGRARRRAAGGVAFARRPGGKRYGRGAEGPER